MDCQEWKDRNLSEGYDHFVKNLDKVWQLKGDM
jgi:hypothetical protein